jgi:hypothetical protein
MEQEEISIKKIGKCVYFEFVNSTTRNPGHVTICMSEMGKAPDNEQARLKDILQKGEIYAYYASFYPNGEDPRKGENGRGRASKVLTEIINYCSLNNVDNHYCFTVEKPMQDFLSRKGFKEIKLGHYFFRKEK